MFRVTFSSYYSPFASHSCNTILHPPPFAGQTRMFNCLKNSRLSRKWRRIQNNCDTRMRRMENNVGRVWHDMSLFSISISIALLSSYIRESGNGTLMVQTIFSNFSAFKHLTTVNLQHIRVTINKRKFLFYCSAVWPVVKLKIIL